MAEPETERKSEALPSWEAAADEAIAVHDGDARAAIVALLHIQDALEHEMTLMRDAISFGFARGCFHRDGSDVQEKG